MVEQMAETLREESESEEQTLSESDVVASISFGRFESDMLCWERWSSFSQNKYLEEVEKCSTPGSVAKKKAYFEAHYKRIAARKAELLEQEQQLEVDSLQSEYPSNGNPPTRNIEFDKLDVDVVSRADIDDPKRDGLGVDCQGSLTQGIKKQIEVVVSVTEDNPLTAQSEELPLSVNEESGSQTQVEELPVLIQEENHSTGAETLSEKLPVLVKEENNSTEVHAKPKEVKVLVKNENISNRSKDPLKHQHKTSIVQVNKAKDSTLKLRKDSQKRTSASKENNLARTKAKPATPVPKQTHTSLSRASKPSLASPVMSTARTSTRKGSSPSILRKENVSSVERKRSTSNSLHNSLSMASVKSDSTSLTTTRRSLIMENMADKEIVKRAFKAFQNTYEQSKPTVRAVSSPIQQVSKKGIDRIASSTTSRKDKQGPAVVNQTSAKAGSSSFGLRSDERAEKRREILKKKMDDKSKAKEAENTRLRLKSKDVKDAGNKKLHQSLHSKATSIPDFNQGQRVSKIHVNKDSSNSGILHRPEPCR